MRVIRIEAWQGYLKNRTIIMNLRLGHGNPEKAKRQAQEELVRRGISNVAFSGVNPNVILRVFHEHVKPVTVVGLPPQHLTGIGTHGHVGQNVR